ncbi:neural proliferation differentiation and control protein 1-like [Physella acuta]|uniref:neural proliferation differentiation and control protein 1-like n=1 Tax=Physella acuta TaxID=109671 RepID=UPI0027DD3139|nr:neural proliferation differentiation and control protein 1-like [Physella acuta]
MFWKYLIVTLLLVVPSSRFLTLATAEFSPADEVDQPVNAEEKIIDDIITKLQEQQQADSKQINIPQEKLENSQSQGINLEEAPVASVSSKSAPAATTPKLGQAGETALYQHNPGDEDGEKRSGGSFISEDDKTFIIILACAVATGFIGLMFAGVCYYKFRKSAKAASDVEYPAYGVTGPTKEKVPSPGDRKLAQSAQMYHYQHQKQQMIAMEKANGDMKHDASDDESDDDNVEGDYTVYECPGLAPTGEMEVKNPLFHGDETPVTPGQDITGQPHGQEPSQEPEK